MSALPPKADIRCRNRPYRVVEIKLLPLSAEHFGTPRRRQDAKLQSPRVDTIARAKLGHKRWNRSVRHCRTVLDFSHLAGLSQQRAEVAFPSRRVLAGSVAADSAPVEH